jgi:hypothetical protein
MDGNCSQLTGVHGFLITTRTISGADIWKDLPGWTKKSSRKRIELGDALSGAYFERIYYGRCADGPIQPSDILNWHSFFYNDKHFFTPPYAVDNSGSPAESSSGLAAIAQGTTTCVVTTDYARQSGAYGTTFRIMITPLDIDANITKWKVTLNYAGKRRAPRTGPARTSQPGKLRIQGRDRFGGGFQGRHGTLDGLQWSMALGAQPRRLRP